MANPVFKFEEAERVQLKASIMIEGLSGEGKTGLALMLAYYLADEKWDDVFHIDTENKSANLFAGIPFTTGGVVGKFKVGQLTEDVGYKPSNYIAFRKAAIQSGAKVVIEDSISHAWQYKGGVLDLVNNAANKTSKNDKYAAWRDEEVNTEKQTLLDLIRSPQVHVISTVRVKEKFEYVEEEGKNRLKSMGEQQIQQGDLKYEPDLVLHMISPGMSNGNDVVRYPVAEVLKSRYAIIKYGEKYEFTPELCRSIRSYLAEGVDPQVLLEQQRQEYINAITEHLNAHPNKVSIWNVIKADAGYDSQKLSEIPLEGVKRLFITLTT